MSMDAYYKPDTMQGALCTLYFNYLDNSGKILSYPFYTWQHSGLRDRITLCFTASRCHGWNWNWSFDRNQLGLGIKPNKIIHYAHVLLVRPTIHPNLCYFLDFFTSSQGKISDVWIWLKCSKNTTKILTGRISCCINKAKRSVGVGMRFRFWILPPPTFFKHPFPHCFNVHISLTHGVMWPKYGAILLNLTHLTSSIIDTV